MSEESSNVRVSDGKVGRTERVSDQSDVFMMSVMLMIVSDERRLERLSDRVVNQADRMNCLKADRSQKLSAGSHDHSEGGGESQGSCAERW